MKQGTEGVGVRESCYNVYINERILCTRVLVQPFWMRCLYVGGGPPGRRVNPAKWNNPHVHIISLFIV